jgi:hypothetical protein
VPSGDRVEAASALFGHPVSYGRERRNPAGRRPAAFARVGAR